jgi:alpha-beta hydrolase superfamily lysophospholipase
MKSAATSTEGTFDGVGGVRIAWRRLEPPTAPRGVVVVSHGYAEYGGRYREFAEHLVERGIAAVGLDHRGHGTSGGPRGHCLAFDEFVADLRTLVDMAAGWWPDLPRVLFGHSMGGLIAFLYLLRHGDTVRAGALTGPAFAVPPQGPAWQLALVTRLARFLPRLGFATDVDADALSRDPEVGKAYLADPLVHHRATAAFARSFALAQAEALAGAPSLRVPLLILQGDADRVVDPNGAKTIDALLTGEHELVWLRGYYHELLNEPPAERKHVLDLLDAWCDRWLG